MDPNDVVDKKTFQETVENLQNQIISLKSQITQDNRNGDFKSKSNKGKSFREYKKEAVILISTKAYLSLLCTHKFFKNIIWLVCILPLIGYCIYLLVDSYQQFLEYNVVTQIKIDEEYPMIFPAITFCPLKAEIKDKPEFVTLHLNTVFVGCSFELMNCSINDFIEYKVDFGEQKINCYQFNTGRDANNNEVNILKSLSFGLISGFFATFKLSVDELLIYFVGDNQVRPIYAELINMVQPGKYVFVDIKKTVDIKLPKPYSNCTKDINAVFSDEVKKIVESNITYRAVNCMNNCFFENFKYYDSYDEKEKYCANLCPLECQTNSFDVTSNELSNEYNESLLSMNFFYYNNKVSKLTQSVKTSPTDLISNIGGTLGLFLELSFVSIIRLLLLIYDIFFFFI